MALRRYCSGSRQHPLSLLSRNRRRGNCGIGYLPCGRPSIRPRLLPRRSKAARKRATGMAQNCADHPGLRLARAALSYGTPVKPGQPRRGNLAVGKAEQARRRGGNHLCSFAHDSQLLSWKRVRASRVRATWWPSTRLARWAPGRCIRC
jgi:hypothetical protein